MAPDCKPFIIAMAIVTLLAFSPGSAAEASSESKAAVRAKVAMFNEVGCKITTVFKGEGFKDAGKRIKIKDGRRKTLKAKEKDADYTWTATGACCPDGASAITSPGKKQGNPPMLFECGQTITAPFGVAGTAFAEGETVPVRFTCEGANFSPEVWWWNIPAGTRSLVLIVDDPDAPGGTWTHFVLFDIAPDLAGIPEDFQVGDLGVAGRTSFGRVGYGGPCPPVGHGPHRYYWTLYALDVESLGLNENAKLKTVRRKMRRKILAEAEFMGLYERQ